MTLPEFPTKKEFQDWLYENKSLVLTTKKNTVKHGDVSFTPINVVEEYTSKAEVVQDNGILKAELVINSCGIIDSHMDLHVDGLWKKSVSENKNFFLLQEHHMEFDKIIADSVKNNLKAVIKTFTWKELGVKADGSTTCLVFESDIPDDRNPYMHSQYAKGYVMNHSVGMRYVNMFFCVNSEEKYWAEEKKNWDKYISKSINPEQADRFGYFNAVTEAKFIEGSAVVIGSNRATPTINIESAKSATQITEPSKDTQKQFNKLFLS